MKRIASSLLFVVWTGIVGSLALTLLLGQGVSAASCPPSEDLANGLVSGGAIQNKWNSLKNQGVDIGSLVGDERTACSSPQGTEGAVAEFTYGHIHFGEGIGAYATFHGIDDHYVGMGGSASWLGYPTSDEENEATDTFDKISYFEGGVIVYTHGVGTEAMDYDDYDEETDSGGSSGDDGGQDDSLPVISTPDEGEVFEFVLGASFSIKVNASDPDGDKLAYHLRDWVGSMEMNQKGLITWKATTLGLHEIKVAVKDRPFEQTAVDREVRITFFVKIVDPNDEEEVEEPPPTTTPVVSQPPAVVPPPSSGGGGGGGGSFIPTPKPTTTLTPTQFPSGKASCSVGASYPRNMSVLHLIPGSAIEEKWWELRSIGPDLGYPQGAETNVVSSTGKAGKQMKLERGTIIWASNIGACEIHGGIEELYFSIGGPNSYLGLPTSDEHEDPTDVFLVRNTFEGGVIGWDGVRAHAHRYSELPTKPVQPEEVRQPFIRYPSNLFYYPEDTAVFSGIGTPGSYVWLIANNRGWSGVAAVDAEGKWAISGVPTPVGDNSYQLQAFLNNTSSQVRTEHYRRAPWHEQVRADLAERFFETWYGRVLWGEPESLEEHAARVGLDLVVVGDVLDVTKHGLLILSGDDDGDPTIAVLASVGLITSFTPQLDAPVSAFKAVVKTSRSIERTNAALAKTFEDAGATLLTSNRFSELPALAKLAVEVSRRGNLDVYARLVGNDPEQAIALARYADKTGDKGLDLVERIGRGGFELDTPTWPARITNHVLDRHPFSHWSDLGIGNAKQLEEELFRIVENSDSIRFVYRNNDELRYGFYDEARNIIVAVHDDGTLATAFRPDNGTQYVRDLDLFFEVR